jgi:AcrR family transcriptional regulator
VSTAEVPFPPRRRNPRGQGRQLSVDILQAGRQIIEQTGDETRVSLSEIARRVGISAPSIYDHFTGIDDICGQVVAGAWTEYARTVAATAEVGASLHAQVLAFARAYVRFAREHWGLYRVLYARTAPSPMPDTGDAARADFARLVTGVAGILGVEPVSEEAWDAAVGLWIQLHGIASLPPVHPRFDWPDDERLIDAALRRSGLHAPAG